MEPIKTFKVNKKLQQQGYLIGVVLILFFFIGVVIMKKVILFLLILGIFRLVIAGLQGNHTVVKVFSRHFEIQKRFIGPRKKIKNLNLISVKMENKKLMIKYMDDNEVEKSLKLLKTTLNEENMDNFVGYLRGLRSITIH